jgi:hypothetical protein
MSKRDEKIEKYARDLKEKAGIDADMDLLTKVVIACGPTIYNSDSETVATSDAGELRALRDNWVAGKLGVDDDDAAMGGIQKVIREYGRDNRRKYRASLYYMLTTHFGKESALG